MLTVEGVFLLVAIVGLMWRQRGFYEKRPWVMVVLLGAAAILVTYEGLPMLVDFARFGIAAAVAQAVKVEGRARAMVFAALGVLISHGPEGDELGSWPLSIAAVLLIWGLPRPLPTGREAH